MFPFTKETYTALICTYQIYIYIYILHHSYKKIQSLIQRQSLKHFQHEETTSNHSKTLFKHYFLHKSEDLASKGGKDRVSSQLNRKVYNHPKHTLKNLELTFNNMHDKYFITVNKYVIMSTCMHVCWFHLCFSSPILSQLINC